MAYTEEEARGLIIEAGHRLLETHLVARTWGNISARISDTEFLITPSGRAYETLTEDELVRVRIDDLSYTGDIKPSSEKGIHADAYALRADVDFAIHTHQLFASAVCASGEELPTAPCAGYGLPGTEKLRGAVRDTIRAHPGQSAFLMARHGAFCLGETVEDAFRLAETLEATCRDAFIKRTGIACEAGIVPAYCEKHRCLRAYIDDFAQLVGACAGIRDGAVVTGRSDDAEAVEMIVKKNCAAALYADGKKPLGLPDALVQRLVYVFKYSKLKGK